MKKNLCIKMLRFGKKHEPFFRLGVLPKSKHPSRGYALDYIGWYNPKTKDFNVDEKKAQYYMSLNTELTDTVKYIFKKANIIKV
jgi:small subunit ribosomal protein S16